MKDRDPVVTDIEGMLKYGDMSIRIKKYFRKHHGVPESEFKNIDFVVVGRILKKRRNLGQQVKNMNYQWNTMETCCRWGKSSTQICPIRGLSDETWSHVYMRPNEDMDRVRMSEISKTKTILERLKTLPELKSHFEEVLRQ